MKVKRLERDIPKYLRAQNEWVEDLQPDTEEKSFERESIEDLLQGDAYSIKDGKKYEPVLYEVVKEAPRADREGHTSIQEGFIERTERLL